MMAELEQNEPSASIADHQDNPDHWPATSSSIEMPIPESSEHGLVMRATRAVTQYGPTILLLMAVAVVAGLVTYFNLLVLFPVVGATGVRRLAQGSCDQDHCLVEEPEMQDTQALLFSAPVGTLFNAPASWMPPLEEAMSSSVTTFSLLNRTCWEARKYTAYNNPRSLKFDPTQYEGSGFSWQEISVTAIDQLNQLMLAYKNVAPKWIVVEFNRLKERVIHSDLTVTQRGYYEALFNSEILRQVFLNHIKTAVEAAGFEYLGGGHCVDFAQYVARNLLQAFDSLPVDARSSVTVIKLTAPLAAQHVAHAAKYFSAGYEDIHYLVGVGVDAAALTKGQLFVKAFNSQATGYICDAWFHQGGAPLMPSKDVRLSPLYKMGYKIAEVRQLGELPNLKEVAQSLIDNMIREQPQLKNSPNLKPVKAIMSSPDAIDFFNKLLKNLYQEKLQVPKEIETELRKIRKGLKATMREVHETISDSIPALRR